MNSLTILQMISVFFGTVMAAPLMVSKKPNKRIIGYLAMTIGCIAAILVQVSAGLYIFILANLYWVLNSDPKKNKPLSDFFFKSKYFFFT